MCIHVCVQVVASKSLKAEADPTVSCVDVGCVGGQEVHCSQRVVLCGTVERHLTLQQMWTVVVVEKVWSMPTDTWGGGGGGGGGGAGKGELLWRRMGDGRGPGQSSLHYLLGPIPTTLLGRTLGDADAA